MSRQAKVVKYLAFALVTLFGILGGLFAAGYAFSDLTTAQAIGTTAPWLVIGIALSAFAHFSRRIAPWVMAAITVLVSLRSIAEAMTGLIDRDDPFWVGGVLVLAVALGFLGLHRALWAGALIGLLAVGQFIALIIREGGAGAPLSSQLTSSSGVVVVPLLIVGALFVSAGLMERSARSRTGQ